MKSKLLIEPHYFPSVAYFSWLTRYASTTLEIYDHYPKQTYRNRCYVRGANRVQMLSIPIQKVRGKTLTRDIQVEAGQSWRHHHWRTIRSAYGNAPFFDFFAQTFHDILYQKNQFLIDINTTILTECRQILQLSDKVLTHSQSYQKAPPRHTDDLRDALTPRLSPHQLPYFRPVPYNQVFGKDFAPNLSVIDLLFCEGSQANSIIRRSIVESQ